MDAQKMIDCLKDFRQANTIPSQEWDALSTNYPYFTAAHWMAFAANPEDTNKLPTMAMYKSSPWRFAAFVEACKHPAPVLETANLVEEVETITYPSFFQEDIPMEDEVLLEEENIEIPEEVPLQTPQMAEASPEEMYLSETSKILEEVDHDTQDILDIIQNLPNAPLASVAKEEEAEVFEEILHDLDALALQQTVQDLQPDADSSDIEPAVEEDKSLMVMMSFTDWLNHFKHKQIKEQEEEKDQKALKTAWKKEKLAAAVEEEQDDIPDNIFKQAMDSISLESSIISESLAEILAKQGKKDKAIEMYKKLSLRNPEKSSYFASLIKDLNLNNF